MFGKIYFPKNVIEKHLYVSKESNILCTIQSHWPMQTSFHMGKWDLECKSVPVFLKEV